VSVSWNLFISPTYYTPLSYRASYSLILMQNMSEVLATYARTIHTVELHSKSPAAYHPIPYKLCSIHRKALHIMHVVPFREDLA